MPATGSLQQLSEAVTERLDGAPVGERRRWSDEFKERAVAAALEPGVNVSGAGPPFGDFATATVRQSCVSCWKLPTRR
ncbi:transposase [Paracoccus liaowanqingii]